MPLYEYQCQDCEEVSEFQMKMADPDPESCPKCGYNKMKRILSAPSFQLKGGGWYSEGYDGKSNKKPASSSSKGTDSKD